MIFRRVFVIVADSFGIGKAPDAALFGDRDCNTLKRISESRFFLIPNLLSLGLGNIDGIDYLPKTDAPKGSVARLREASMGKDTTIGHWEMSGIISSSPLPTYPDGFPEEILRAFSEKTGRKILCNKPYSGTDVIRDYGKMHRETGALIVYTSSDSVFQIAAHEEIIPVDTLYEYCRIARKILTGKHGVGRVIARPFIGNPEEGFTRTKNRRDFSLEPPGETMLDKIKNAEVSSSKLDVISVGKIYDIFASRGITEYTLTHDNAEGMQTLLSLLQKDFHGLCYANLVDFDMLYGHRQDIDGYAKAIAEFDRFLPSFLAGMKERDALIITADHGCDPGDSHTDHTRKYVPFLLYSPSLTPHNFGTKNTFSYVAKTVTGLLGVPYEGSGEALIPECVNRFKEE